MFDLSIATVMGIIIIYYLFSKESGRTGTHYSRKKKILISIFFHY